MCFDLTNTLRLGHLETQQMPVLVSHWLMGSTGVPNVCTFNKKIYCEICIFKCYYAMHIFHQQNEVFFQRLDFKYSNRWINAKFYTRKGNTPRFVFWLKNGSSFYPTYTWKTKSSEPFSYCASVQEIQKGYMPIPETLKYRLQHTILPCPGLLPSSPSYWLVYFLHSVHWVCSHLNYSLN